MIQKYGATSAQILLAWGVSRGHIVIPRSSNLERIEENILSLKVKLENSEVETLTAMNENVRICNKYEWLFGHNIYA